MAKKYYAAYGSNLNVPQMLRRCPGARVIGTAVIPDYRLLFKGSKTGSYLTIEPAEGYSVPVGVWEVSDENEAALDRYEGYPTFYYKKEMILPICGIRSKKVRNREAFIYIMHEERPFGIPSPAYVHICRQGYHSFGFDDDLLDEALIFSADSAVEEAETVYEEEW